MPLLHCWIAKVMKIPKQVQAVILGLNKHKFEAYIVGGCVRDLIMGREPKDWDVATSARPEQIQKVFPDSFYKNKFGTVTVRQEEMEIEVTTFRVDEKYTDKRHPDKIRFARTIKEDLARRDFTINAIALGMKSRLPSTPPALRLRRAGKPQINSRFQINPLAVVRYHILS